jgi:hypothetical protein
MHRFAVLGSVHEDHRTTREHTSIAMGLKICTAPAQGRALEQAALKLRRVTGKVQQNELFGLASRHKVCSISAPTLNDMLRPGLLPTRRQLLGNMFTPFEVGLELGHFLIPLRGFLVPGVGDLNDCNRRITWQSLCRAGRGHQRTLRNPGHGHRERQHAAVEQCAGHARGGSPPNQKQEASNFPIRCWPEAMQAWSPW